MITDKGHERRPLEAYGRALVLNKPNKISIRHEIGKYGESKSQKCV
jgi:hypothetical protein